MPLRAFRKIFDVWLKDGSGNAITSLNGALDIHDADVHTSLVNSHARLDSGTSETFGTSGASSGDSSFDVATGQGGTFAVNNYIIIYEGSTRENDILKIISVVGDTLTVDRPLENDYTSSGVIEITERDLSTANGTIAAPVIFEVAPPATETWHITMVHFHIEDEVSPGIELFGGIASLTNGLVVRQKDGTVKNIVVIRNNGDMKELFGGIHVEFIQKVGGGDYATNATWHFQNHTKAIIKLIGANGDKLQFIVQDNLTALTMAEIIVHGHHEDD